MAETTDQMVRESFIYSQLHASGRRTNEVDAALGKRYDDWKAAVVAAAKAEALEDLSAELPTVIQAETPDHEGVEFIVTRHIADRIAALRSTIPGTTETEGQSNE